MKIEHAEEYTQALAQVVSGGWRQIALGEQLGVPRALGMTTREWVEQRLGGYVRLSMMERQQAVQVLKDEGRSNRNIGDVLGIHERTVRKDKAAAAKAALPAASDPQSSRDDAATAAKAADARLAALPDDLARRVREGMNIDEAEHVARQREQRIAAYVARVRAALDLFERMVGHPVPADLSSALSRQERALLRAVIGALAEKGAGRDANAA